MNKLRFLMILWIFGSLSSLNVALAFNSPLPANTRQFKIEQSTYLDTVNKEVVPAVNSTFDVTVINDNTWSFKWVAPIQKNTSRAMSAEGQWIVTPLKNGAFELNGFVSKTTEALNGKDAKEYTRYNKIFYPVKNKPGEYYYTGFLSNNETEKVFAGSAHFVFK